MKERLKQLALAGRGAMAEVYRGRLEGEQGTSRPVAIKRLRPELRDDAAAVDLFVNEARIAVRLSHANIVHGLELGRDDDGYYLLCEWLDCISLDGLVDRNGKLGWPAVVEMGRQLGDALIYLHGVAGDDGEPLEVVHRDVSPGNVFLTRDAKVKLGDFGVACSRDDTRRVDTQEVGTPGFAAPEQKGGGGDIRSDVYGLGATLRAVAAELPAPISAVLDRAIALAPEDRFGDARALVAALDHAVAEAGEIPDPKALGRTLENVEWTPGSTPGPALDGAVQTILGRGLAPQMASGAARPVGAPRAARRRSYALALVLGVIALSTGAVVVGSGALQGTAIEEPRGPPAIHTGEPKPVVREPEPPPAPAATPAKLPQDSQPPAPTPVLRFGVVSVNAVPWAQVSIDGSHRGNTPLRDLKLSAGKHRLRLRHPPEPKVHEHVVEVTADRAQAFIIDLRRGKVTKRLIAESSSP